MDPDKSLTVPLYETKGLTARQAEVLDMRRISRLTFSQIAAALGISKQSVHEHYQAAKKYVEEVEEPETSQVFLLSEKREYIDARLRMFDKIAEDALADMGDTVGLRNSSRRVAIEALNGSYKYLEVLIKMEGLEAPKRHSIELTMSAINRAVAELEGRQVEDGSYTV